MRLFRSEFPAAKFIGGITARGAQQDTAFKTERYRPLLDLVQQHENCEVMLMTSEWLSALTPEPCRDADYEIAEWLIRPGIVHAREPAFVPWAQPFEPWLLWQLAQHPNFFGGKISTLDEPQKKFRTGTGRSDTRVYKVFEAFQSLEDQIFRFNGSMSAAAYKHSTAHVLPELGIIASFEAHPACRDLRGADEGVRMTEALRRPIRMMEKLGLPYELPILLPD